MCKDRLVRVQYLIAVIITWFIADTGLANPMVEKEKIMYVLDPDRGTGAGVELIENQSKKMSTGLVF
jgi:hypothetical protein